MKCWVTYQQRILSSLLAFSILVSIGCDDTSTSQNPNRVSTEVIVKHGSPEDIQLNPSAKHVRFPPASKPIDILVREGVWVFGDDERVLDFDNGKASLVSILGPPDSEEHSVNVTGGFDGSTGSLPTKLVWDDYGIAAEVYDQHVEALYFILCDPPDYEMSFGNEVGIAGVLHASTSYSGTITVRRTHADGSLPVIKEKYVKAGMSRDDRLLAGGRDIDVSPASRTSECASAAKLINTRSEPARR